MSVKLHQGGPNMHQPSRLLVAWLVVEGARAGYASDSLETTSPANE